MSSFETRDGGADAPLSRDPGGGATATNIPSPQLGHPTLPYGYQWEMKPKRVYPIETKPFFLTSEFLAAVLVVGGIAITAAASDAFGAWRAWILISAVTIGYMVSRGIAKSGTRSHADDPRESFDLPFGRGGGPSDGR